jgi:hypothetical protein
MKSYDFECVIFDGEVYCSNCLPDDVDINDDDVTPVFASCEVSQPLVCCECHGVHDYMNIIGE